MKRKQSTNQELPVKLDTQSARRKLLRTIAGGSAVASTAALLPTSWVKPVIDSVALPAHAQTSPGGPPTSYALTFIQGPTILAAAQGSPGDNIICRTGSEFEQIIVGVTPADGSKDGLTISIFGLWTDNGGGSAGKVTGPSAVTISGNQAEFRNVAPFNFSVCSGNPPFVDIGSTVTLQFTISDGSAPMLSAGPYTAESTAP